jgi:hypothetical protein
MLVRLSVCIIYGFISNIINCCTLICMYLWFSLICQVEPVVRSWLYTISVVTRTWWWFICHICISHMYNTIIQAVEICWSQFVCGDRLAFFFSFLTQSALTLVTLAYIHTVPSYFQWVTLRQRVFFQTCITGLYMGHLQKHASLPSVSLQCHFYLVIWCTQMGYGTYR